jgi:hypothetical protein
MDKENKKDLNEFECYGESLNSSSYYFDLQRKYEEDLLLISLQNDLDNQSESIKFVSLVSENPMNIEISETLPKKKTNHNEKNIL